MRYMSPRKTPISAVGVINMLVMRICGCADLTTGKMRMILRMLIVTLTLNLTPKAAPLYTTTTQHDAFFVLALRGSTSLARGSTLFSSLYLQ